MKFEASDIASALASNEELETKYGDGDRGNFLSGWQCDNPYADGFIARAASKSQATNHIKYSYIEYDDAMNESLANLHKALDNKSFELIFPSACGSTSILFTFCTHLAKNNIKEIYYIPPIYFSMHYALKLFNIKARPISALHAYEEKFSINLPNKRSVLIFVDPLWFAGRKVPHSIISQIKAWQDKTGSTIFVDGSFQYMPWNGDRYEATSELDPSITFRMICPTKIMAVHGLRFSYALMPATLKLEFYHTYTNIYASSAACNVEFARESVIEMKSGEITRKIINLAKERYSSLVRHACIESSVPPDCGYFTFTKILSKLPPDYKLMTQEFFEQKRYNGYAKLNLVSPSFYLIDPARLSH